MLNLQTEKSRLISHPENIEDCEVLAEQFGDKVKRVKKINAGKVTNKEMVELMKDDPLGSFFWRLKIRFEIRVTRELLKMQREHAKLLKEYIELAKKHGALLKKHGSLQSTMLDWSKIVYNYPEGTRPLREGVV